MRYLVLSYGKLMQSLVQGLVSIEQLQNALFCFACSKEGFETGGWRLMQPELWERLHQLVAQAEMEGRIRWRPRHDGDANFALVNDLLVSNGYPGITTDGVYHPGVVADRLPADSGLQVIAPEAGLGRLVIRGARTDLNA